MLTVEGLGCRGTWDECKQELRGVGFQASGVGCTVSGVGVEIFVESLGCRVCGGVGEGFLCPKPNPSTLSQTRP